MSFLTVNHSTIYTYREPVRLGEHRTRRIYRLCVTGAFVAVLVGTARLQVVFGVLLALGLWIEVIVS